MLTGLIPLFTKNNNKATKMIFYEHEKQKKKRSCFNLK